MALSGYEKQKRWREKNRALYNLQQRNRRKIVGGVEKREVASPYVPETKRALVSQAAPPTAFKDETLAKLRELVEEEKPATEASVRPDGGIYRNDSGGVISKYAWEKLQRLKEKAREGGYILDEYSQ